MASKLKKNVYFISLILLLLCLSSLAACNRKTATDYNKQEKTIKKLKRTLNKQNDTISNQEKLITNRMDYLTEKDIRENFTFYFYGRNGEGEVRAFTNLFNFRGTDDCNHDPYPFKYSKNNGTLKNGDKINLEFDEETLREDYGYLISDDFKPEITVRGLKENGSVDDTTNLGDVKQDMKNEIERYYYDIPDTSFKIKGITYFYRTFELASSGPEGRTPSGTLTSLITVEETREIEGKTFSSEFYSHLYASVKLELSQREEVPSLTTKVSEHHLSSVDTKDHSFSKEQIIDMHKLEGYIELSLEDVQ